MVVNNIFSKEELRDIDKEMTRLRSDETEKRDTQENFILRLGLRSESEVRMSVWIPLPAKAGSVVLFHSLTWHRSLENHSSRHRRAFIVSYQDAKAVRGNRDQHKILRPA